MKIIAGGGTGGHLFPAVALGEELMRERPDTEVLYVGTRRRLRGDVAAASGIATNCSTVHGLRGHSPLDARLRAIVEFVAAIGGRARLLKSFGADLVVSAGGYASAPMGMAAIIARTPLVLMEQNTTAGFFEPDAMALRQQDLCRLYAELSRHSISPKGRRDRQSGAF